MGQVHKRMPYKQRLRLLGLPMLIQRRRRGDMIETYKCRQYPTEFSCLKLVTILEPGVTAQKTKLTKGHYIRKLER
jgi:hypothetical protein